MNLKLKPLVALLLAALAASAMAIGNASAETGGHFVTDDTSGHTVLKGVDKTGNTSTFVDGARKIVCDQDVTYAGSMTAQTVTEIKLTPTFATGGCTATHLGGAAVHVDVNGCYFLFTIGSTHNQDNTTHLKCPTGAHLQMTIPSLGCTLTIRPQTPASGSGYYNIPEKEITIKPTLREMHVQYIGGFFRCGAAEGTTSTKGEFDNRISLKASNTAGEQKSITATGPED